MDVDEATELRPERRGVPDVGAERADDGHDEDVETTLARVLEKAGSPDHPILLVEERRIRRIYPGAVCGDVGGDGRSAKVAAGEHLRREETCPSGQLPRLQGRQAA